LLAVIWNYIMMHGCMNIKSAKIVWLYGSHVAFNTLNWRIAYIHVCYSKCWN